MNSSHSAADTGNVLWGLVASGKAEWGWSPVHQLPRSSKLKFCKIYFGSYFHSDDAIRSQFCTCHDSWAAVTYAKLLSDWIIIVSIRATCIFWQLLDYEHTILSLNGSLAPLQKYGVDPWSSMLQVFLIHHFLRKWLSFWNTIWRLQIRILLAKRTPSCIFSIVIMTD